MIKLGTIRELCTYSDFANDLLVSSARGVSDEQLDRPVEMGRGDLRKTLLHIYAGEYVWLQRWKGNVDQPWVAEGEALSVADMARLFAEMRPERDAFLASLSDGDLDRRQGYLDTIAGRFTAPLGDMLLQACTHSMHHRAQASNMLRQAGVKPPGIDYLRLRIEQPTIEFDDEVRKSIEVMKLTVAEKLSPAADLDPRSVLYFYRYGDWAFGQLMDAAEPLSDEQLDRRFEMGMGTLRQTLLHIHDADRWWCKIWSGNPPPGFEVAPESTSLAELRTQFEQTRSKRDGFVQQQNADSMHQATEARFRPELKATFRLGETMLQLCGHGTHHRAQAVNMLRRLGAKPPELDYMMWVRKPA